MDNKVIYEDKQIIFLLMYKTIEMALKDLAGYQTSSGDYYIPCRGKKPLKVRLQEEAKKWLLSDDCELYCEAIRIDHDWLVKEIDRVEHGGERLSIKKERFCNPYIKKKH